MSSHRLHPEASIEMLNARTPGTLPGWFGVTVTALDAGRLTAKITLRPEMLAPNGYLHAASVIDRKSVG